MKDTSLIRLIKSFSKKELKEFLLFVKSPYFNNEKVLISLSEIIFDSFPDFDKTKEEVFSKLYPGKNFNDSLSRNIYSDMMRLAEEFLAIKNYRTDKLKFRKGLLSELSKRNIADRFLKQKKIIADMLSKVEIKDGEFYYNLYELESEHKNFITRTKDLYIKKEALAENIIELLVIFFLIKFTYFNAISSNRKKIIHDSGVEPKFEYEIENILHKGKHLLEIPYIKVFYYLYKIIKDESEEHFHLLKAFTENNLNQISEKDWQSVFTVLTNFSYMKVLAGNINYIKEQFEISKTSIEKGVHKSSHGFIPHIQFMNIVITGLDMDKVKWVEDFIEKYSVELKDEFRTPTQHFCRALIFYNKKSYDKALRELALVETEDFSFKQQIKSLYLKIYFDLNEPESFYFHVDSYKHFVTENKLVHDLVRKQLSDYISYTKRLFDLKSNVNGIDKFALNQLEKDVIKNKSLVNKKWILEKIKEIKTDRMKENSPA